MLLVLASWDLDRMHRQCLDIRALSKLVPMSHWLSAAVHVPRLHIELRSASVSSYGRPPEPEGSKECPKTKTEGYTKRYIHLKGDLPSKTQTTQYRKYDRDRLHCGKHNSADALIQRDM